MKFKELSPKVQEEVIERMSEKYQDSIEDWWYEEVIEEFKDDMQRYGIEDVNVYFSGFGSQGDGASFEGIVNDQELFLKNALGIHESTPIIQIGDQKHSDKILNDLVDLGFDDLDLDKYDAEDLSISFDKIDSRYHHDGTMSANISAGYDLDLKPQDERDPVKELEKLEEEATEWAQEEARNLYSKLESTWEELNTTEGVQDWIEQMDYDFDEEGNLE